MRRDLTDGGRNNLLEAESKNRDKTGGCWTSSGEIGDGRALGR